ncbi:IS66 family transposase [Paenibacillus puerhi]|uniref:IS66 family transposase n=1 Tax=Paenibacillus puerhi TaxID=2692622 RepID=UPI001358C3AC|nr:IS66 family transposase [Paenibacillus puerhi]
MSPLEQLQKMEHRIGDLEKENKRLQETVQFLTQKLYGKSSEKTASLPVGVEQLSLFDEPETAASRTAPELTIEQIQSYQRKRQVGERAELLQDLPHEKQLFQVQDRCCDVCHSELVLVGEEFVRTEVEFIPARVQAIDIYRETLECRTCRKADKPQMKKATTPVPVIQHSLASASSVAWVMYQKFVNSMPLYRQEKEWKSIGLDLSRATMANWMIATTRDWLKPLVNRLHELLVQERYLHADETPLQVMNEKGRKNTTSSYMWIYSSAQHSTHPIRIFEYQPGRGARYPQAFLKGFKGYLHSDAYSGYANLAGTISCLCWAHLRRKFVEALPPEAKNLEGTLATEGVAYCNKLFELEAQLASQPPEERKEQRLLQEKPVLDGFWSWVEIAKGKVLPKSKLGEALKYARNHRQELMNYLQDGNCVISNNLAENSIRPFTVGRKNWLFSGSPRGAAASAGIYSIVETAKANGLNPYKYLVYLLQQLPAAAFRQQPELLDEHLPWSPAVRQHCT